MLILGHTGIGRTLAAPFARGLPDSWFIIGALLPDLIDKSLYYGFSWSTGLRGSELGLFSGTRTLGHTGILMLAITAIAAWRKSRVFAALALGLATHLLLDALMDMGTAASPWDNGVVVAIFFPLAGVRFPVSPFEGATAHMRGLWRWDLIGTEIVGGFLLGWHFWKNRHETTIVRDARQFAQSLRKRLRWRRTLYK